MPRREVDEGFFTNIVGSIGDRLDDLPELLYGSNYVM